MTRIIIMRERPGGRDTNAEGTRPCEGTGRNRSDTAGIQGLRRAAGKRQKLGGGTEGFP